MEPYSGYYRRKEGDTRLKALRRGLFLCCDANKSRVVEENSRLHPHQIDLILVHEFESLSVDKIAKWVRKELKDKSRSEDKIIAWKKLNKQVRHKKGKNN